MKTLLVGFGNELRSDDGLGPYVAKKIEELNLPHLQVRIKHQLNVEIVSDMEEADQIIFVDAAEEGENIDIHELKEEPAQKSASSHQMDIGWLKELFFKLWHRSPNIIVCSIRGEQFNFGTTLSETALRRADEAVKKIKKIIRETPSHA